MCFGSVCGNEQELCSWELRTFALSLFLMEREVRCSDSGTHSDPVCEMLLLPTNASQSCKGVKVKDPQLL